MNTADTTQYDDILSQNSRDMIELADDLADFLPPWSKASASQRRQLVSYGVAIYLPITITISCITSISVLFVGCYLYPILSGKDDDPALWYWHSQSEKDEAQTRAWVLLGLYTWFTLNLSISFYRACTIDPGKVPKKQPWLLGDEEYETNPQVAKHEQSLAEKRKDGYARKCLKCYRRKPDRCHHCRLCERCVLKMDHHCPWIATCVGLHNYKFFFLLILNGCFGLLLFTATFWETVVIVLSNETISTGFALFIVCSYTLAVLLTLALIAFCIFHIWLLWKDYTTVEYCEKRTTGAIGESVFRESFYKTLQNNLGPNPLLWFLPIRKDYVGFRDPDDSQVS
jgi:hypothetical protein